MAQSVKNLAAVQESQVQSPGRSPGEGWLTTPVFFPGELHGQRSLVDYIVHGIAKSQTWQNDFHFTSLHCLYYTGNSISQGGLLGIPKATLSLNYLLEGFPGWLPSMGLHRVRHDWSDLAAAAAAARFRKAVIHTVIDWYWHIYTTDTMYMIDNQWKPTVSHKEL